MGFSRCTVPASCRATTSRRSRRRGEAGILHFESGGGASFQSAFFYANENAFDVMDAFRAAAGPDANLQTLARGINVVGLESQPSDVIRLHAQLFAKHGITHDPQLRRPERRAEPGAQRADASSRPACTTRWSSP